MEKRNTRGMTETEYRNQIDKIRKDREIQAKLNEVAEEHVRKRSTRPRPNPPRPKPAVRYVQPQPPLRGLLAPEPTPKGFMGLLATSGSKG
jgi:hypothetical protein